MSAPPRRYKLVAPVVAEHPLQEQFVKILRLEIAPPGKVSRHGVCWYTVDHANYAGEVPGVRVARGIIAGVLDTFLIYRGRSHFLEIKTTDGALSEHQKAVATAVLLAGGLVGVATTAEQLLACLDEWQIPRSRRVRVAA